MFSLANKLNGNTPMVYSKGGGKGAFHKILDPVNATGKISKAVIGDSGGKSRDPFRLTSAGQNELSQERAQTEEAMRKEARTKLFGNANNGSLLKTTFGE